MASPRLEMWVDSPLTTVATYGETAITFVHTELTMDALRVAKAVNTKICRDYPEGVLVLSVVCTGIRLPDATVRKAASEAMNATRSGTRAVARVFLGEGFWLSSVRSVLTAIELLQPYDIPRRTFGDAPRATRWLAHTIRQGNDWAEGLNQVVSQLARPPVDGRVGVAT